MEITFNEKMMAGNIVPAFPTHPGEMLKEGIGYRVISQRKLAEQMGNAWVTFLPVDMYNRD